MLTAMYVHETAAPDPSRSRARTNRTWKIVEHELKANKGITSASGFTAALAVNICTTNGWDYQLTAINGRYHVMRKTG